MSKSEIRSEFLFTAYHHLTDEGIAVYVDALRLDDIEDLPVELRQHVAECLRCKLEISELDDVMQELDNAGIKEFTVDEFLWKINLN